MTWGTRQTCILFFLQALHVDLSEYGKINEWLTKCKNKMVGYEEANQSGINGVLKVVEIMDEKFKNTPPAHIL